MGTKLFTCYMLNVSPDMYLQNVEASAIDSWLEYLSSVPRAAQLLKSDSEMVLTLENVLDRYLKDVKRTFIKADKR